MPDEAEISSVEVFSRLWPVVDWFMDVMPSCEVRPISKTKRSLIGPTKSDVLSSVQLLKIDHTREQYDHLKQMIRTAINEFK